MPQKKITVDTSILVPLGRGEISWTEILDVFIDGQPIEVYVTSAALQEFHKKKPYPERIKILEGLRSYRTGYGSRLYGQGFYGGAVVNEAKVAGSLFTVGYSEIGAGDQIGTDDAVQQLSQILHYLTNGSYKGWNWQELKGRQINQYRDAQAFEAHLRYKNDIFLTADNDFDDLKGYYNTTILSLNQFKDLSKKYSSN